MAELLTDLAHSWRVDERGQLFDVLEEHAVVEGLVAIVQLLPSVEVG